MSVSPVPLPVAEHPLATATAQAAAGPPPLELAALFLGLQARSLVSALRRCKDRDAVAEVLRGHDASHRTWLEVVTTVERGGDVEAVAEVAALYELHGRVAGMLERGGTAELLGERVSDEVLRLVADHLLRTTGQAVALLHGLADAERVRRAGRCP